MTQDISQTFRIAVAQLNPTVGDIAGNLALAREARKDAAREEADIILFTELFLSGYPPEDLVLKPAFLKACLKAVEELAADTADGGPGVIIGFPRQGGEGRHNSIAVLDGGKVIAVRDKIDLPNYGEFDEKRVFIAGDMPGPVNFRGVRLGIPICEDIWGDLGVCETLSESGAEILLVPNGSPYYRGKVDIRHQVVLKQVIETGLPMIYAAQARRPGRTGLRRRELCLQYRQIARLPDEPVRAGRRCHRMETGRRDLALCTRPDGAHSGKGRGGLPRLPSRLPRLRQQERFQVGRARPLRWHRQRDLRGDRRRCARRGEGAHGDAALSLHIRGLAEGRGRLRQGARLPLRHRPDRRTGGRVLVRTCRTVRGHRRGDYRGEPPEPRPRHDPDGDLQQVRLHGGDDRQQVGNVGRLRDALWRHERRLQPDQGPLQDAGLCAGRLAQRTPAADGAGSERRGDPEEHHLQGAVRGTEAQPDRPGSLPPYPALDDILECLVELEMGTEEIIARGHDIATVHRIEHLLYLAEYKRRQSAPGVKITKKNFGRDRRYPITNRFRDR